MESKVCTICKFNKPLTEFYKKNLKKFPDRLYYKSECKTCHKLRSVSVNKRLRQGEAYRAKAAERRRERYRTDAEYRERTLAERREYVERNKGTP